MKATSYAVLSATILAGVVDFSLAIPLQFNLESPASGNYPEIKQRDSSYSSSSRYSILTDGSDTPITGGYDYNSKDGKSVILVGSTPASSSKPAKPAESPKPAKPAKSPKPAKPAKSPKPAKPAKSPKPAKPTIVAEPSYSHSSSISYNNINTNNPLTIKKIDIGSLRDALANLFPGFLSYDVSSGNDYSDDGSGDD